MLFGKTSAMRNAPFFIGCFDLFAAAPFLPESTLGLHWLSLPTMLALGFLAWNYQKVLASFNGVMGIWVVILLFWVGGFYLCDSVHGNLLDAVRLESSFASSLIAICAIGFIGVIGTGKVFRSAILFGASIALTVAGLYVIYRMFLGHQHSTIFLTFPDTWYHANMYAGMLVLSMAVVCSSFLGKTGKAAWLLLFPIAFGLLAIGMTGSRGSWVATAAILFGCGTVILFKHRKNRRVWLATGIVMILVGFGLSRSNIIHSRIKEAADNIQQILEGHRYNNLGFRVEFYRLGGTLIAQNPFLGVGAISVRDRADLTEERYVLNETIHLHNDALEAWSSRGAVGLLSYLAILLLPLGYAFRNRQRKGIEPLIFLPVSFGFLGLFDCFALTGPAQGYYLSAISIYLFLPLKNKLGDVLSNEHAFHDSRSKRFCSAALIGVLAGLYSPTWSPSPIFEATLTGEMGGRAKLYWDSGNGFSENESKVINWFGDEKSRVVEFPLPPVAIKAFRLDPAENTGVYTISDVAFTTPFGNRSSLLNGSFTAAGDFSMVSVKDDKVTFLSSGTDPQVLISTPPEQSVIGLFIIRSIPFVVGGLFTVLFYYLISKAFLARSNRQSDTTTI